MVDAPERIWATFEPHESGKGHPRTYATAQKTKGQEYIRSDIPDRQIAELRAEYDKLLTSWAESRERHLVAEADKARLSEAMEPLVELIGAYDCADEDGGYDDQSLITVPLGKLRALRATLSGSGAGGWRTMEKSPDYFGSLVERARKAATKATAKFPQPNYVTLKIAEEAGEVVRGAVHYAEGRMHWSEVEGEIVQLLAMLLRFVTEGDQINGVIPPAAPMEEAS